MPAVALIDETILMDPVILAGTTKSTMILAMVKVILPEMLHAMTETIIDVDLTTAGMQNGPERIISPIVLSQEYLYLGPQQLPRRWPNQRICLN